MIQPVDLQDDAATQQGLLCRDGTPKQGGFEKKGTIGSACRIRAKKRSVERPVRSYSTLNSPEVFYRKSPAWVYEREWRLIRPLAEAARVLDHPAYPRALFRIPFEAVKGVIIGAAMPHEERSVLLSLLTSPALKHVTAFQTRLSDNHYSLEVHPPVDGSVDPNTLTGRICEAR